MTDRGCTVRDCPNPHKGHGLCSKHLQRKRKGLPLVLPKDTLTYMAVHMRLRRSRGPASNHQCADCDRQAEHWSYQGGCLEEQTDKIGKFCSHQEHYVPRCTRCHRQHDGTMPELIASAAKSARDKTHCKHGHEFTPENIIWEHGWRRCRTCHNRRQRKRRARARGTINTTTNQEKS